MADPTVAELSFIDAWVRSDAPTKGFGSVAVLDVLGGANPRVAFLQSGVPCPPGATIVSAKLRLRQFGAASAGNRTLSLRRVSGTWGESTITYRNRPGRASTATAAVAVAGTGVDERLVEFDVLADVQSWVNGAPNYGWALESSAAQLIRFNSKDAAKLRPQLVIEWTAAPERPTSVQPSGGLFASTAKPLVRWNYADRGSQIQALTGVRLQTAADAAGWAVATGFPSPTFDSGNVAATVPEFDLAGPAAANFAGIGSGQKIWYTVQHRDASGQWSQWSDPQQVGYQPATSVSITAPAATINDTAFVVAWSTSNQERYQVLLRDPRTGKVLWDSGEQVSATVRDLQVPRGAVTRIGQQVQVIVRVWDGAGRISTPGAAAYAQAAKTLTYADTTAVAKVTDLLITESADSPTATVSWKHPGGATQFGIWVDGTELVVVDADDVATGSAGYSTAAAIAPGAERQVAVKAIAPNTVDGITQTRASANSPTVTYLRSLFAVWLVVPGDPSRDIRMLQEPGAEIVATSMPEVTSRFEPVGSSVAVHVTTALRWFEGSVTDAVLADYGTLTAEELRRRMLRAKGDRLTTYTLMWGTHAVPVHISNVDVAGDWIPGATRYDVSFDFSSAVPSPEYELS